jgi:hypothetical protein
MRGLIPGLCAGLAAWLIAAPFHAGAATAARGGYEIETAKVEEVFDVEEDGYRFVSYRVKWNGRSVIVSDPLAKSRYGVGDEIRFMAHRGRSSRPEGFSSLGFTLVRAATPERLVTPEGRRSMQLISGDLTVARDERERFYALNRAAKKALDEGEEKAAAELARELERLAPKYVEDWNHGNVVQDANQVLGRIALKAGDVAEAKRRLMASADSQGSPQMNSFGPNLRLAKELLEKGERETVLEYLRRCRSFWKLGGERLDRWEKEIRSGMVPEFGGNLSY